MGKKGKIYGSKKRERANGERVAKVGGEARPRQR